MRTVIAHAAIMVLLVNANGGTDTHHDFPTAQKGKRTFHILKELPIDAAAYQSAAQELVKAGVPEKFGHEEWAAIVLTNEIHQHVGIYSILGAKMGVRAKEMLDAPPRTIDVTVETGGRPPVSCLIDGLQAAIGSTFGQNLIHAPDRTEARIAAAFQYKGQTLHLALKPEFQKIVDDTMADAIKRHGNLTPAYFEHIEMFSYRIWAEFDRSKIFDEVAR